MWQRSTKERRGDGSYLVLNGQCFGGRRVCGVVSLALPRDRTRWCRGGVDSRCRRAVQSVQWSGQPGGRRAARGVRDSGAPGGGLSGQDSLERERVRALQASRPGLA